MYSDIFLNTCYSKLDTGLSKLNLKLGIVSHIENDNYHLIAVRDASETFKPGADFSLGDTYCREVWNKGKSVSIPTENIERKIQEHPLYVNLPLEAYISSPIMHDSKIWGTINFSAQQPRAPFNEQDIQYVERLAEDISAALSLS